MTMSKYERMKTCQCYCNPPKFLDAIYSQPKREYHTIVMFLHVASTRDDHIVQFSSIIASRRCLVPSLPNQKHKTTKVQNTRRQNKQYTTTKTHPSLAYPTPSPGNIRPISREPALAGGYKLTRWSSSRGEGRGADAAPNTIPPSPSPCPSNRRKQRTPIPKLHISQTKRFSPSNKKDQFQNSMLFKRQYPARGIIND